MGVRPVIPSQKNPYFISFLCFKRQYLVFVAKIVPVVRIEVRPKPVVMALCIIARRIYPENVIICCVIYNVAGCSSTVANACPKPSQRMTDYIDPVLYAAVLCVFKIN